MRLPLKNNKIKLDFLNKIRYFSAVSSQQSAVSSQQSAVSSQQSAVSSIIAPSLSVTISKIFLLLFFIRLPRSPTTVPFHSSESGFSYFFFVYRDSGI